MSEKNIESLILGFITVFIISCFTFYNVKELEVNSEQVCEEIKK